MGNFLSKVTLAFVPLFCTFIALSQSSVTITGNVHNATSQEKVPAASVTIKGTGNGTFTDDKGNFHLTTSQALPLTLVISSIGFETQEIVVSDAGHPVQVNFKPASSLGVEIVVSASRVPEKILESPVSIERVGAAAIRTAPSTDYYNIIRTVKGVDVTTSSLTFNSVTTRGFNGSGNPRFNQFVDGMDNQAPGLNFSVGSVIGLTQLDVDNMELLQGASSALYGSGGMNGTLLISSKDPFKYQGVSAEYKQGIMHLGKNDPFGASPYTDLSFRWGMKVSDKFAFKVGGQYIEAKDWAATNTSNSVGLGAGPGNHPVPGNRASDPNYNGVNVYGDETSANMQTVANGILGVYQAGFISAFKAAYGIDPTQAQINGYLSTNAKTMGLYAGVQPGGNIPNQFVSRTGYNETDVIDHTTKVLRVSGGLYYKFTPHLQLSLTGNYGTGNTVYTGSDRYSLKDLKMGQYKLELKADRWFIRAYTTQENSGQAYNATVTTQLLNEAWSNSRTTWYPTFMYAYLAGYQAASSQGASPAQAQAAGFATGRQVADANRPAPGSAQFNHLLDSVRSLPIPKGGLFLDRTNMYQTEGQYNLTDYVKFMEVIVGASWRYYVLNSQGTLFADSAGRIKTNEYGAYIQIAKKFFQDKLKLTASGRYDKNDNFEGKFTPRFSAVYEVVKDNYIRASFQNAYRFPSNQNQWINLNTGSGILIGGLPSLRDFYHFNTNPVYTPASVAAFGASAQAGSPNPGLLQQQNFGQYKPESSNSFELGYKGLYNKRVLVDVYGYYARYQNLIGRISVIQSNTGNPIDLLKQDYTGFSVSVNSSNKISTYGFGASMDYLLPNNFSINVNASSDHIHNPDPNFTTYFNTPNFRFNVGLSNSGFGWQKRFGFGVQYRWQNSYFTQSDFKQGDVDAFGTLDALVSFKLPAVRSLIKLGATNLTNHYYVTSYGNPAIGGIYYVSYAYNVF